MHYVLSTKIRFSLSNRYNDKNNKLDKYGLTDLR